MHREPAIFEGLREVLLVDVVVVHIPDEDGKVVVPV